MEKGEIMSIFLELVKAAIFGAIILYGTSRVIENDIRHLQDDVKELKSSIDRIKRDVYRPFFLENRYPLTAKESSSPRK